jgi:hypothetical protein
MSKIHQFSFLANTEENGGKFTRDSSFIEVEAIRNDTVLKVRKKINSIFLLSLILPLLYITNKDAICIHLWTPFSVYFHSCTYTVF